MATLKIWKSFSKRINSTKVPNDAQAVTKTVHLKEATSYENPVFILDSIDDGWSYCAFGFHYYFIDDVVFTSDHLYELHCTQDVMASYRNAILSSTQFVERSASSYDTLLSDNLVSNRVDFVTTASAATGIGLNVAGQICCRVIGKNGIQMIWPSLPVFLSDAFDLSTYIQGFTDWEKMLVNTIYHPMDYIVDARWFPILASQLDVSLQIVSVGLHELTNNYDACNESNPVWKSSGTVSIPTVSYTDFRAYDPRFTEYKIYIPGIGTMPLSCADVKAGITYTYMIDIQSGNCTCVLKHSNGSLIGTYNGSASVPIQLGKAVPDLGNAAMSSIGALGNFASENYASMAQNLVGATLSITSPTPSVIGSAGNVSALKEFPNIIVSASEKHAKDIPNAVAGQPLMQNVVLNTLSGYCKCGNPSIEIDGFGNDRDAINSFMASGFYIE